MENCPNCGNQLSSVDVLCPRCGTLVEVIKINPSAPVKSSGTTIRSDNVSDEMILPPQKDYQQNFTVYSDEMPPAQDSGTSVQPDMATPADPGIPGLQDEAEWPPSPAPAQTPEPGSPLAGKSLREALEQLEEASEREEAERQEAIKREEEKRLEEKRKQDEILRQLDAGTYVPDFERTPEISALQKETPEPVPEEPATPIEDQPLSVNESSYSKEYLDAIRNMQLPEIDDLSDFDPDAFMKEYSRRKAMRGEGVLAEKAPAVEMPGAAEATAAAEEPQPVAVPKTAPPAPAKQAAQPAAPAAPAAPAVPDEPEPAPSSRLRDRLQQPVGAKARARQQDADNAGRRVPIWLSIFLWLAVAAAIFAGFLFLDHFVASNYGSYNRMFYEITDGKLDLGDQGDDVAFSVSFESANTDDGQSAHLFHINSRGGKSVYVPVLDRVFELEDGRAEILIADSVLAAAMGLAPAYSPFEADGVAFNIGSSSERANGLMLTLEPAEYARLSPGRKSFSTTDPFFVYEASVGAGAVVSVNDLIFLEGQDFSGTLIAQLPLERIGENVFEISVTEPGRAAAADTLTINRFLIPAALNPGEYYMRVYADTFTVSGTADPYATIRIASDFGEVSCIADSSGAFFAACTQTDAGLHALRITASRSGRADTTKTIHIERLPEVNAFVSAAKDIAAPNVPKDADALHGLPVRTSGSVKNVFLAGGGRIFILYTDEGELNCIYYGTASLETGSSYTLYGVFDSQSGRFYAMYVS